jgi:hypothetical protein
VGRAAARSAAATARLAAAMTTTPK